MKKRLFIAINLPEEVKDKIEKEVEKFRYDFANDIRFLERKNWHITVTFLGYQADEFISPILESINRTCNQFQSFGIELADISYGPKGKTPRMIWLNGKVRTSERIAALKDILEDKLSDAGVIFKKEHRQVKVHITLARFKGAKELPDIDRELKLNFQTNTLDLMESHLSRPGADYEILQRVQFK